MTTDPVDVNYFTSLDAEECWALLAEAEVGRVAWVADDGLSVVPVNFRVIGRAVVFHTSEKSFLSALLSPTSVAFQADEIDPETATGWSVLIRGRSGPHDGTAASISWLDSGQTLAVAITETTIAGRVVSGQKK